MSVIAVAFVSFIVGVSTLPADDQTRFGINTGASRPEILLEWGDWTGTPVQAAGETLSANTWDEFSGKAADSGIGLALAAWEELLRESDTELNQDKMMMEFSIPLFPDRAKSGEPSYHEIESRWVDGSKGNFNEHFRDLAEVLVEKGWGAAHLRLAPEFNVDSKVSLWGIRDKPKNWPHFKAFWKRIHESMMSVEGAEFKWVWSTVPGGSEEEFDPFEAAWPGDDFVDVVSVAAMDESQSYYWQQYENEEPTQDWFALRRWNWEEKAYGVVRDPYTGESAPEAVPSLSSYYDFARAKGKRFAISRWGVVNGERFPNDEIWGGNDNPLFIEAMSHWISSHEVDYALYHESFTSSRRLGNRDHSILPDYWNRRGANPNAIHPDGVGNPLSSIQFLECFHSRLPEGFSGGAIDAPVLVSESFAGGVSSLWELEGPWEVKRDALHIANGDEAEQAVAKMKTPSINRQAMEFQLLVASEGEGVSLQVGPWRLRVSLLSDGRLGLVSLSDTVAEKAVSTSIVSKPYVIGETYVPVKMELTPGGVAVWVGDEQLVSHESEDEMEMSMDIKIFAGAGASIYLKSLEVRGSLEEGSAQ